MLQKYIVAEVCHDKKNYHFHETIIEYDKNISSLLLSDDYVKKDIDGNISHMYSLFQSMINAGIYSSMSSILRAIKNEVIKANLVIIYTTDLDNISITNGWYMVKVKDLKYLREILKYMASVQYSYSFKSKAINRLEIYGDPILGNYIQRDMSELVNNLDESDINTLDSDKIVNTYGLSRELGEFYNNGKSIMNNARITPWEVHINPPLINSNMLYFQLYNAPRVTATVHSSATKCARISMTSPEYIHCSDCSKEEWILTDIEKEKLCKVLTNEMWENLKDQYCRSLFFKNDDMINKIKNLPMPDYMKL